ncbi:Alpha-glucosidase yihQ [Hordeum vulgare]|nr:Alpha-glucosidase yihQ [Hordeum vulgare]
MPGSGIVASPEAVRSVWCTNVVANTQPLRGRAKDTTWASSDTNMARRARRVRQRTHEAAAALAAVDVGEAESHSVASRIMRRHGRCNRVVVDIDSFQEGSVND